MSKISIIIPIYNGEAFLGELLQSVIDQSFCDWECLCVIDGSTDGSRGIAASFVARDNRFVLLDKVNGGTGDSRNFALDRCHGDYVMFADQDDILHKDAFGIALQAIEQSKSDILLFNKHEFASQREWDASQGQPTDATAYHLDSPLQMFFGEGRHLPIFVWQYIYRRSAIGETRFPKLTGGEDAPFIFSLVLKDLKWSAISPRLYGCRAHEGSVSRSIPSWYIDNGFASNREICYRGMDGSIPRKRLLAFTTCATYRFMLSIVLRHGRGPHAREHFNRMATLCAASSEFFDIGLLHFPNRQIAYLMTRPVYPALSFLAWTLGWLLCRPAIFTLLNRNIQKPDFKP